MIPPAARPYISQANPYRCFTPPPPPLFTPFIHSQHYVFVGEPGTGKSTGARALGEVFHSLGLLSSPDNFVERKALDLIGPTQNSSAPRVNAAMEEALGGVLVIDDAHGLAQDDPHLSIGAGEAVLQLLGNLTDPRFKNKLLIVLTDSDYNIDYLFEMNAGLRSQFEKRVELQSSTPKDCVDLVVRACACAAAARVPAPPPAPPPYAIAPTAPPTHTVAAPQYKFAESPPKGQKGTEALPAREGAFGEALLRGFEDLSSRKGWANVRDVENFYKVLRKERDTREIDAEEMAEKAGGGAACEFGIEVVDIAKAFGQPQFSKRPPWRGPQQPPPREDHPPPPPPPPGLPGLQALRQQFRERAKDREVGKEEAPKEGEGLVGTGPLKERELSKQDEDGEELGMYALCKLPTPLPHLQHTHSTHAFSRPAYPTDKALEELYPNFRDQLQILESGGGIPEA